MEDKNCLLYKKIFNILGEFNGLDEKVYLTVKKNVLEVMTKEGDKEEMEDFFEINLREKILHFSDYPKSSSMEVKCIDLAHYLRDQKYKTNGVDEFIEKPRFKPGEFSLD
jgi:hypothetical protein